MESSAIVARIIEQHRVRPGALLPMLHAIQDALGCIPPEAVPPIAQALNLSRAEVHGVISYYAPFSPDAAGRHVVRVCCAEACQAVGGEALAEHARARLAGSGITLEPVYCLGLCACGPAVQVDETNCMRGSRREIGRTDRCAGVGIVRTTIFVPG
jgi:formate dehydrogenase subunit gamma